MGPGYNGDMLDPQPPASVTDAPLDAPAAPAGTPSDVSEAAAAAPVRAQSDHTDPFPAALAGDGPDPAGLVPPVATAGLPADPDRHAGVTWGWAPVSPAGMDRPRSRPRWRSWSAVLLV